MTEWTADPGPVSCSRFGDVTPVCYCKMSSLSSEDILKATDRIKPYVRRTPLEYSHWLSEVGKSNVYVKLGK